MSEDYINRNYKELITKVKRLTTKEKYHILSIFKKYNIEFTKNSNGYFFNLDKIDDNIIDKVSKCVDLIEQKRELITSLDKKRDYYLEYYKTLIESKLKDTINKKRNNYLEQLVLIPSENFISKKKKKFISRVSITEDPDVLMKEHLKKKKYHKNSVYFRITQRMHMLSRKTNHGRVSNTDKDDDSEPVVGNDMETSGDGGIDESGSVGGMDYDDDDLEGVEEELNEDIVPIDGDDDSMSNSDYVEFDNNSDIGEDEYYKDSEADDDTTDIKTDNKTEKTDRSEKTTKMKKSKHKKKKGKSREEATSMEELDYYKQILKQSGFKFDDDREVVHLEEYII